MREWTFTYCAVPKLSGQVYQTVEIAEPNDSPFFSCNARLYNENEYVGEIKIKDHMAKGVLRFPLGIEPEISISRILQKGYVKNKILKGNNQYVGSYIIELHNRKKM
ncbi:MAG: hypothetical protein ACI4S2_00850 [Lachnospiraceae bacterium]